MAGEGRGWGELLITIPPCWERLPQAASPLGHGPQGQGPAPAEPGQGREGQASQRQQQGMTVGEDPHQQVGGQQGEKQIGPAPSSVGRTEAVGRQRSPGGPFGELMQHRHIPPAEIQPLAAHRMAAVGAFPHQHRAATMQAAGQLQRHRKAAGLHQQGLGLEHVRQDPCQPVEEGRSFQSLQLLATGRGRAPDQLEATFA
jgi:hypothetical protein